MKRNLLVIPLLLPFLYGCGVAAPTNPDIRIALSMPDIETPEHIATINAIDAAVGQMGYVLEYAGSHGRLSGQISSIETLSLQKPDYMIISPTSLFGLEDVVQQLDDQDIPVILLDNLTRVHNNSNSILAVIVPDHFQEGMLCARSLADSFDGEEGRILEIQGPMGLSSTRNRALGFRKELREHDNLDFIMVDDGNAGRIDGYNAVREALARYGSEVRAVFAHTDTLGIGALDALLEADYSIPVVSIGGTAACAKAILTTDYYGSVNSTGKISSLFSSIGSHQSGQKPGAAEIQISFHDRQNAWDLIR